MFQFDSGWDVDKEAESLNTSLFGKAKKKGHQLSSSPLAKKSSGLFTSIIHDSDDEIFSKKGKKRLKERRRKKKKNDGTSNMTNTSEVGASSDGENEDLVQSVIHEKGKKGKARQVSKQIISDNNAAHRTGGNSPNLKKKKKEKRKLDTNSNANETDSLQSSDKKEKRKRKRSHTENPNDEESGSKSKRVKTEKDGPKLANATAENKTPGEDKKKRKRNRKKKNNSKKNKYKHLALNSKDKVLDSNTPDAKRNGGIPNRKEDSRESVLSNKKTKEMKKVIQTAQTVPVKQTSSPKSISTQSKEKKAEKRKHDEAQNSQSYNNKSEENHQDVADKKKRKKKHNKNMNMSPNDVTDHNMSSHKEVTDRSLALPAKGVAQTPVGNTPRLKTLSKPKLKQHILAKMLNGIESPGQSETQEKSAKKKQKKKKDKLKQDAQRCDALLLGSNLQQLSPKQTSASSKFSSLKTDKAAKSNKEIESQTKKTQPNAMKIASDADSSFSPAMKSLWGKAAELQQNAKEKLDSARFRFINEQLYTCKGDEALDMFREDKEAFSVYHQGFENQVKKWPVNPQNVIIKQLKDKPTELVIADFGCGDAKLAQSLPHKVHSFDLVALNKRVTVCDMSKTPLPSEKVDIAVFCLSLMGTNINDYIAEANRILKTGGLLKIAEVVSRFSGVSSFIEGVCSLGFQLLNKRDLSQMFYMMDFKKVKSVKKSAAVTQIKLKPCVYKRR